MTTLPQVRPLEAFPLEREGQDPMVLFRDPMHLAPEGLAVGVPVYLLMTLMDGQRSAEDVAAIFAEQYGGKVDPAELTQLSAQLDEHGLLLTPRFFEMRDAARGEFDRAELRPAALAGLSYPEDAESLREQLENFHAAWLERASEESRTPLPGELRALVAPHIDPRVGGAAMAAAFETLTRALPEPPDTFVLFGTAHGPGDALFTLCDKDFETPLGRVALDREAARALTENCGLDLRQDLFLHKHEHSLEFPLLFLQHAYGPDKPFRILPILVGSFHEFIRDNELPSATAAMQNFCRSLREALETAGHSAVFVAGADFSHMGAKFGDEDELNEEFIEETRNHDNELIEHLVDGRHEDFFREQQVEDDRHKVCGLPPVYAMLEALGEPLRGRLVDYGLNVEEETSSFVSFASLAFYRDGRD